MTDSLQVKLSAALLEEVLERLAEQIHDHDMVHLTVVCLLIADEVEEWHVCFTAHFVNEF